jgi:dihydroxy-acid dehydratase
VEIIVRDVTVHLHLRETSITSAGLGRLISAGNIQMLELSGSNVDDALLKILPKLPLQGRLALESDQLTDEGIQPVAECRHVVSISVTGRLLTNDCLEHLTGLPRLEGIALGKNFDAHAFAILARLKNLKDLEGLKEGQKIIHKIEDPIKTSGHIRIMRGNLAPKGAVAKITGKEGLKFSGPAKCYDSEELMLAALEQKKIVKGDVVIIRYEGPKGGPGMPEMLTPTSAIMGAGLGSDVALMTDGRFSGGSHGFIVGHITPEAQGGGPIALVKEGDKITIDADTNRIDMDVSVDELARRKAAYKDPPYKARRGTLYKYIKSVKSASEGCVTDE